MKSIAYYLKKGDPQVLSVLKYAKGKPHFYTGFGFWKKRHGVQKSLTELSFGEVTRIKKAVAGQNMQGVIEAIKTVYGVKNPLKLSALRFYQCFNFLIDEVQNILKVEKSRYTTEPPWYEAKLQQAGVEDLAPFSDLLTVDTLAGGDILKYAEVEKLPYLTVHCVLWARAIQQNIKIRMEKIK